MDMGELRDHKGLIMAALDECFNKKLLGSIGDQKAHRLWLELKYEDLCKRLGKKFKDITEEEMRNYEEYMNESSESEHSNSVSFNDSNEMHDHIISGKDIYNPELGMYVFAYNDDGAICYYHGITPEKASAIAQEADRVKDFWSAILGGHGYIIDPTDGKDNDPVRIFCSRYYKEPNWVNTAGLV